MVRVSVATSMFVVRSRAPFNYEYLSGCACDCRRGCLMVRPGRGSHGGRRVYGTDLPEASMGGGLIIWARNLQDPKQKGATALLFLNANTTVCDSRRCGGEPLACNQSHYFAASV